MSRGYEILDVEETLRTVSMVESADQSLDVVMWVKSKRAGDISGESDDRQFADKKPRMKLLGYFFAAGSPTDQASGLATGRRQYSAIRVVRSSDAATASLLSMFATNETGAVVDISVFRAGGEATSKDAQPMLHIVLKDARVKTITLFTGGEAGNAMEIVDFAFREISVESAPQKSTGARGAVRSFMDSVGDA